MIRRTLELDTAMDRVAQGVELMQKVWGDEWRQKLRGRVLVMNNQCLCVLGVVAGHFDDGLRELGADYTNAWRYGFDVGAFESTQENYETLRLAWELTLYWNELTETERAIDKEVR